MQKKAFTLIELIIVITIIGVLTAVAISNFFRVGDNYQISNKFSLKIAINLANKAYNIVPAVYMNLVDMNGDFSAENITLQDLVMIYGKNWNFSEDNNTIAYRDTSIKSDDNQIIELELSRDRRITLRVFCNKFVDLTSRDECYKLMPNKISTTSF